MNKKFIIFLAIIVSITSFAQKSNRKWQGSVNVEFSKGIAGYSRDFGYMSTGVAACYGLFLNEHYFIGIGLKPNYIFSDGDFNGFFLPIYGEFKYKSLLNEKCFGGFGIARVGYSVVDQKGIYANIGGGFNYKNWEFGLGVSYQYTKFKEETFFGISYNNYNLVFGTISLGYGF